MRRCVYCGHPCRGTACQWHKDLLALDYYAFVKKEKTRPLDDSRGGS